MIPEAPAHLWRLYLRDLSLKNVHHSGSNLSKTLDMPNLGGLVSKLGYIHAVTFKRASISHVAGCLRRRDMVIISYMKTCRRLHSVWTVLFYDNNETHTPTHRERPGCVHHVSTAHVPQWCSVGNLYSFGLPIFPRLFFNELIYFFRINVKFTVFKKLP